MAYDYGTIVIRNNPQGVEFIVFEPGKRGEAINVTEYWHSQGEDPYCCVNLRELLEKDKFRTEVIDALVVHHVFIKEHETDARLALSALLDIVAKYTLEPKISKEARDLIDRGRYIQRCRDAVIPQGIYCDPHGKGNCPECNDLPERQ